MEDKFLPSEIIVSSQYHLNKSDKPDLKLIGGKTKK